MDATGMPALLILLALVIIVIGPGRLSDLGGAINRAIGTWRHRLFNPPDRSGPPDCGP
ncbi:MAG: twin-arginine translocase TatA/TatE family subunit [Chloroflexales bacterium]